MRCLARGVHHLAAALTLASGLAAGGPVRAEPVIATAAELRPSAQALIAVELVEARLARIGELQAQSRRAGDALAGFKQQGDALLPGRIQALQALGDARAARASVADCLAAMSALRDAQTVGLQTWQESAAHMRRQAQTVASARGPALANAMAEAQRRSAARTSAEQALSQGRVQLGAQLQTCRNAAVRAAHRADLAASRHRQWERGARELAQRGPRLREQVDAALAGARSVSDALLLNGLGAATWPDAAALDALPAGLDAAPSPGGDADIPAIDLRSAARVTTLSTAMQARIDELARLEDAATYLDLLLNEARRPCRDAGCAPLAADRADLQLRLERARAALQTEQQALAALPLSAEAALAAPLPQLQAREQRLQGLEAATNAAGHQAAQQAAQGEAALAALDAALQRAQQQALREFDEVYRAAHGQPAPDPPRPAAAAPAPAPSPAPAPAPEPPAMAVRPQLGGHAYELVARWDTEPHSFGAYTYVLLRSAADLQRPDVRRRWLHLLERVMRERRAGSVADVEMASVNLICIPVLDPMPGDRSAAAAGAKPLLGLYASDLGLQWLLRANAGLLTRPELRKKLASSPGPFLITVPARLAEAQAATPVLFADLSAYSDDAVADLVNSYMGSLLADFPRAQAQWKPPVPQRVALQMIRLANDASKLVLNVIPSSYAAPRR